MSEHFCLRIGHDRYNKVVFDADYTNAIFSVRQIAPKYDLWESTAPTEHLTVIILLLITTWSYNI